LYKSQAGDLIEFLAKDNARHFGQTCAHRYSPKIRSTLSYNAAAIQKTVNDSTKKDKRPDMGNFRGTLALADAATPGGSDADDMEQAERITTPSTMIRRSSRLPLDEADQALSPAGNLFGDNAHAEGEDGSSIRISYTRQTGVASVAASSGSAAGRRDRSRSPTSRSVASAPDDQEVDEKTARVKPPAFWHAKLLPYAVFQAKTMANTMKYAKICATRIAPQNPLEVTRLRISYSAFVVRICTTGFLSVHMRMRNAHVLTSECVAHVASRNLDTAPLWRAACQCVLWGIDGASAVRLLLLCSPIALLQEPSRLDCSVAVMPLPCFLGL
jgi:hypothetical protein